MLLLKEDFPKNTAGGNNYKSTDTDSASVPEYVLKAYLTRAVDLIIQSREKGDTFKRKSETGSDEGLYPDLAQRVRFGGEI